MPSTCAPWHWMGTAVHLFTPDFSCYDDLSGRLRGSSHRPFLPGFFRGPLDSRARTVDDQMKLEAARALAGCVSRGELSAEYIIPSVFNKTVAPAVAEGVARAAWQTGAAGRRRCFDVSILQ